jgi:hypothetical protein
LIYKSPTSRVLLLHPSLSRNPQLQKGASALRQMLKLGNTLLVFST